MMMETVLGCWRDEDCERHQIQASGPCSASSGDGTSEE